VAACDAGERPAAPAAKPKLPEGKVTRADAADLRYLPADSDLVVTIDVAKLRQGKLWKTYQDDVARVLLPGFARCNYAPLAHVTTVTMGIPVESGLGVFVIRGLDRDKTLDCLRNPTPGTATSATFDGDLVTLSSKGEAVGVLAFADSTTLVMQGAKATKDTLKLTLQTGTPLLDNGRFMSALGNAKSNAPITLVSRPGSEQLAKNFDQMGAKLQQVYGSASITDRLDLRVSLVVGSLTEATNLASLLQSQRQSLQIKQMFDRFDVIAQGSTMTFEIGMTEAQLGSIATMMRAMMPAD
jgi:hypothetical protein